MTGILLAGHTARPPLGATAGHTATPMPTATAPPFTAAPTTPDPTDFTDPASTFHAAFVSSPVEHHDSTTVRGEQVPTVTWEDGRWPVDDSLVSYTTYPADFDVSTPNVILDVEVKAAISGAGGTVVSKTFETYAGFPSEVVLFSMPPPQGSSSPAFAEARIILAGHTLFDVVAAGLENPPTLWADFVASFKILRHAP